MYIEIPRNDKWLKCMLKEDFDIISLDDNIMKIYYDCDISELLSKPDNSPFILGKNSVKLSGQADSEEIKRIKKYAGNIFISEIKHCYFLDQEGFFGAIGAGNIKLLDDDYFITCYLSENESKSFLNNHVLAHLKDIRLEEGIFGEEK